MDPFEDNKLTAYYKLTISKLVFCNVVQISFWCTYYCYQNLDILHIDAVFVFGIWSVLWAILKVVCTPCEDVLGRCTASYT